MRNYEIHSIPKPFQCPPGDACPVALLFLSLRKLLLLLQPLQVSILHICFIMPGNLADFVRRWHYERTIEEKSRHFRYQRTGEAVRDGSIKTVTDDGE